MQTAVVVARIESARAAHQPVGGAPVYGVEIPRSIVIFEGFGLEACAYQKRGERVVIVENLVIIRSDPAAADPHVFNIIRIGAEAVRNSDAQSPARREVIMARDGCCVSSAGVRCSQTCSAKIAAMEFFLKNVCQSRGRSRFIVRRGRATKLSSLRCK